MLGHGPISSAPISGVARIRNIPRQLEYLASLRKAMDQLRPLDPGMAQKIEQHFRIEWNYHSNSIEGNSYTFGETRTLLLHGLTASGKPLKDSLEIKGHNEAIIALEDFVNSSQPVTEAWIRNLHQVILGSPYTSDAITTEGLPTAKTVIPGKYKESQNHVKTVTGETFYFAEPSEVQPRMAALVQTMNDSKDHPAILASTVHYEFVRIHPFDDGNGRIARLLMNLILMRAGYPPTIIRADLKDQYYEALRLADGGDLAAFTEYIVSQATASAELWLRAANGEPLDNLQNQIRLFKASILRNPDLAVEHSSVPILHDFLDGSLIRFVNALRTIIDEFSELFDQIQGDISWRTDAGITNATGFYPVDTSPDLESTIAEIKRSRSLAKLTIHLRFNGLQAKNHRDFSRKYDIGFNFLTTPQGIEGLRDHSIFHFSVEAGLPSELITTLVSIFSASLMESVTKATSRYR